MTEIASQVQVDNSDVRVTRWTLAVGGDTGEHRHQYDYVVVPITASCMHVTNADGSQMTSELASGVSYYRKAGAHHNVRNAGVDVLDFVEVEVLRAAVDTQDARHGRAI
jgi:mannose-6-phosphate isomerase-like protein (cupin superfamily)